MARAATTTDAFNAVAEPCRRQILDVLAAGERPVNDLVALLGLAQPQVSKHLKVLREVGLVDARDEGRQRIYRLNGQSLEPRRAAQRRRYQAPGLVSPPPRERRMTYMIATEKTRHSRKPATLSNSAIATTAARNEPPTPTRAV
jgi:DNA-binding transcriptional ArsR family regulator